MTDRETAELLKKAVAALEERANAQPCDDAISRDDALNAVTMATVRSVAIENIELIPNTYQRPAKTRWIPCSERLPEEVGLYLVSMHRLGYPQRGIDEFVSGKWERYGNNVIAWMPMPEAYTESEEYE